MIHPVPAGLLTRQNDTRWGRGSLDRSTGTPLGFALLLLFAYAFGWVAWNGHAGPDGNPALASFSAQNADQADPALVWPSGMPQPLQSYEGLRVNAFGL